MKIYDDQINIMKKIIRQPEPRFSARKTKLAHNLGKLETVKGLSEVVLVVELATIVKRYSFQSTELVLLKKRTVV